MDTHFRQKTMQSVRALLASERDGPAFSQEVNS